jgi:hypothetical protein
LTANRPAWFRACRSTTAARSRCRRARPSDSDERADGMPKPLPVDGHGDQRHTGREAAHRRPQPVAPATARSYGRSERERALRQLRQPCARCGPTPSNTGTRPSGIAGAPYRPPACSRTTTRVAPRPDLAAFSCRRVAVAEDSPTR